MRIAICEDYAPDAEHLRQAVGAYFQAMQLTCVVDDFATAGTFVGSFLAGKYEVIFLDIYIGEESGIDVAKRIRQMDSDVAIVFVTSSPDFALDGFSVNALHYLVKPVSSKGIQETFARLAKLRPEGSQTITVMSNRMSMEIPVATILYADIYSKLCTIHCQNQEVKTYTPIDELERELVPFGFLRSHRSYLVNMRFIDHFDEEHFFLKNGESVLIRQIHRAEIKKKYMDYVLQRVRES